MRSTRLLTIILTGCILVGCHYNAELHRSTQDRKLYDDLCARGSNVWRMYYQGTDSAYHRFLVNDMDRWRPVRIARTEITMEEPLPPVNADTALGLYCVDPCNGWRRTAPCWLRPSPKPAQ